MVLPVRSAEQILFCGEPLLHFSLFGLRTLQGLCRHFGRGAANYSTDANEILWIERSFYFSLVMRQVWIQRNCSARDRGGSIVGTAGASQPARPTNALAGNSSRSTVPACPPIR